VDDWAFLAVYIYGKINTALFWGAYEIISQKKNDERRNKQNDCPLYGESFV